MSNEKYEIKLVSYEVSANLELLGIVFAIRSLNDETSSRYISNQWKEGRINADKTRLFSASFNKWVDLLYNEEKNMYYFRDPNNKDKPFELVSEIVTLVESSVAEFYLLNSIKAGS